MSPQLQGESGWALVTAVVTMSLILAFGLATLSWADTGSKRSGEEKVIESTFNLGEAVLEGQVFQVARSWPDSSNTTYTCTQASTNARCPSNATLSQSFTSSDYASGYTWATAVQDNGGSVGNFYSTAGAAGQPGYDASGPTGAPDGKLWVRAQATLRGKTRRFVSLVRAQKVPLPFPRNVVAAQYLLTTNSGKKLIINAAGTSGQPGDVALRCGDPTSNQCAPQVDEQVQPRNIQPAGGDAVTAADLDAFRAQAKASGTYYATCPPGGTVAALSGALVFVESGTCSYNGGLGNNASSPGMFVLNSGTLTLNGNAEYYGLVYAHNATGLTGNVVSLQGTSLIHGAVTVDGPGGVLAGSSGLNIVYDSTVFDRITGYGKAEAMPGSWRELRPTD